MTILKDKNGNTVEVGEKVKDVHGNVGTHSVISGVHSIKFEIDGKTKYTPLSKIVPSEIEKVDA